MERFITNPGLHHLAHKIFNNLDSESLMNLKLVSKPSKKFINDYFEREILIRNLDESYVLNIIKLNNVQYDYEHEENNPDCDHCEKSKQFENMKIVFRFYKEESEISDLKNFVIHMKEHFSDFKTINRVLEKAFAEENWTLINLFEKSPIGLKGIYPLDLNKLKFLARIDRANNFFGFLLNYAEQYWNFDPFVNGLRDIGDQAVITRNFKVLGIIVNQWNIYREGKDPDP